MSALEVPPGRPRRVDAAVGFRRALLLAAARWSRVVGVPLGYPLQRASCSLLLGERAGALFRTALFGGFSTFMAASSAVNLQIVAGRGPSYNLR